MNDNKDDDKLYISALNNDISKLKDAIYRIKDYPGLTGNTSFDEKGDVLKDVMIKEVRGDGSQKLVEIFKITK